MKHLKGLFPHHFIRLRRIRFAQKDISHNLLKNALADGFFNDVAMFLMG